MSSTPVLVDNTQTSALLKDQILPAMLAGLLGLALLYAAGFAKTAQLHNAVHDGRHSASFPCH